MANIQIITDSASDITLAELEEYNVKLAPMDIIMADKVLTDDKTHPMSEIWDRLRNGESIKTSQPSPERFLNHFLAAKDQGDEVVCIVVSSGLSGTYQSAVIAKEMADYDNIHIVDALWPTAAEKLLVYEACRMRDSGEQDAAAIAQRLDVLKTKIRLFASIDSLEYLVVGGRLSKAAGSIGNLLGLKPYFSFDAEGKVKIVKKPRGSKRLMEDLTQELLNSPIDPSYPVVALYACDDANCRDMLAHLSKTSPDVTKADIQEIGAVIGTYIGPGGFGVTYIVKE